jgi:hypothetical protein
MSYLLATIIIGTLILVVGFILVVHAQQSTTTIQGPSPALRFIPQDAYIVPIPPPQAQTVQQNNGGSLQDVLIPIITSAAGIMLAKLHSDKKVTKVADVVRDNTGELVKTKEATKELARVTYNMNPVEAEKITDAPAVKIETLTNEAKDFAAKAATNKLP